MDRELLDANFPTDIYDFFENAKYVKENIDLLSSHLTGKLVDKEVSPKFYKSCEESLSIMVKSADRVYLWTLGRKELGLSSLSESEARDMEEAVQALDTGYCLVLHAFVFAVDRTKTFASLPTDNLMNTLDRVKQRIDEMIAAIYS